jgi:hypothetical protein
VDFAKHGECVAKSAYDHLEESLKEWPDFFEKPWKKIRKSNGILGKLFREISNTKVIDDLLEDDYNHSIRLNYKLDAKILALSKNHTQMFKYLRPVFKQIVRPLIQAIRQIMLFFGFCMEAYMFATDLRFGLLEDSKNGFMIGESLK